MGNDQELIQVNLQLPASALDSLSKLAGQLRKLTAVVNGLGNTAGTPEEAAESGFFDPDRFQALRHRSEESGWRPPLTVDAEARSVQSDSPAQVDEPEGAGRALDDGTDTPDQRNPLPQDGTAELEADLQKDLVSHETADEEIPAAQAAMEDQTPEAPAVRMEPGSQIPEAEKAWAQTEAAELWLPAVQAEVSLGAESPAGAGTVVTAQPEAPASRWTDLTEELAASGPAPLTAEAVSQAFQRDGRRYDNGFPLY